jgi:hypothetical protein
MWNTLHSLFFVIRNFCPPSTPTVTLLAFFAVLGAETTEPPLPEAVLLDALLLEEPPL